MLISLASKGQLPCTSAGNPLIYYCQGGIFNYDPTLPLSTTNPVPNTIIMPPAGVGSLNPANCIAVSPVLSGGSGPALTFYTGAYTSTPAGLLYHFYYYDGTGWVNTGHETGPAGSGTNNMGAGGGYIYTFGINGLPNNTSIYRYDGTGNAVLVLNYPFAPGSADVVVDCSGNFS
ncbi:MAG: hypothetical protein EOP49_48155, partial [Sphingobacteriales bacterium]